ncbi:RNA polymerase factor sigma-54 [Blattabacterium cuenoti]|uniref:RNA polymerase factor sigma-54 n=1 Tax=Blattabacterium cuenoti TaxID=1653831 RepID=UPI00311F3DF9
MLKQQLLQKGLHKLSPQQIKLMKLVQLSTLDFEQKVQQELEENPALEEENCSDLEEYSDILEEENKIDITEDQNPSLDNIIDEYFSDDEIEDFQINNQKNYSVKKHISIISGISFQEYLKNQLHTFRLNEKDLLIADFILGNIDDDGYIRRKITSITDDIFLILGKSVSTEKVEKLLVNYIQKLDPTGVGSRNLQECLLIQLEKKKINQEVLLSKKIIRDHFESFIKKHYQKLQKKLGITKKSLRKIIDKIRKLNPKPGKIYSDNTKNLNHIIPDFNISVSDEKLELTLNQRNIPELKISSLYLDMLKSYQSDQSEKNIKDNEGTIVFLKKKINSAKWFVDAIKQRQNTLMLTMNAIMDYQKEYFLTGDPVKIKPMILKNISKKIGVGISTVSRVANSKYVNTPYGTFLIKSFFSEKMMNQEGKEISSIEIKKLLKESIDKENKIKPLTDEKLSKILRKKGYLVARRTIAKYRDQMHLPVARMRKNL